MVGDLCRMNQPHPLALVGYGAMAIPTGTSSFPGRPSGSKVTLTNWKRVAITPFEIPADGPAQAVHWRDYVVLFDVRKKEMYLYHHRCGIWSAASTFSDDLSKAAHSWGVRCQWLYWNKICSYFRIEVICTNTLWKQGIGRLTIFWGYKMTYFKMTSPYWVIRWKWIVVM